MGDCPGLSGWVVNGLGVLIAGNQEGEGHVMMEGVVTLGPVDSDSVSRS